MSVRMMMQGRQSAAAGTAAFTESFDAVNGDTLGPNLTWAELTGDIAIVSNGAEAITLNAAALARAEHDIGSVNHYAQADCRFNRSTAGSTQTTTGLLLRHSGPAATQAGYYARFGGFNGTLQLYRYNDGSITLVAESSVLYAAALYTKHLRVEVSGTGSTVAFNFVVDGTSVWTPSDTSASRVLTSERAGLGAFNGSAATSSTRSRWDNFEAGVL